MYLSIKILTTLLCMALALCVGEEREALYLRAPLVAKVIKCRWKVNGI